jgi:hypothetical protein
MEGKTKLVLVNTILNVFVFMVVQRKPNWLVMDQYRWEMGNT